MRTLVTLIMLAGLAGNVLLGSAQAQSAGTAAGPATEQSGAIIKPASPPPEGPGLGRGIIKPATPAGTATASGANAAGGVPNGPNAPTVGSGNAGAGGGVSPSQQ